MVELTPLRPREFFSRGWAGPGCWQPARLLRRLPGARRLWFHTSTTWLTDDLWVVHDTLEWEDGTTECQDWLARLVARDRIRFTGPQMPGGTHIHLREDGFDFDPYYSLGVLPFLPVRLLLRCHDACRWDSVELVLTDIIEVRFLGRYVGRLRLRLRPEA